MKSVATGNAFDGLEDTEMKYGEEIKGHSNDLYKLTEACGPYGKS